MDGVKVDSLNTFKAMILLNRGFHEDFDKCVMLYKDFLKHYDSTQIDKRQVLDISSGGRGKRSRIANIPRASISSHLMTRKGNSRKSARNAALTQ